METGGSRPGGQADRKTWAEHKEKIIYTLPKGVGVDDKVRLRSVGWANMPERMELITEEDKAEVIAMMVA